MTWLEVLSQLGVFGIGIGALGWLARTITVHWLNKDVEQYRSKLQNAHDVEMEKLRSDLRLRAIEHEIRFRSIHEKQARILARTYAKLHDVYKAVSSFVKLVEWDSEPSKEEKHKHFVDAYEAFRNYFFPSRIAGQITKLVNKLTDVANEYTRAERRMAQVPDAGPIRDDADTYEGRLPTVYRTLDSEIPPLLEALQREFQRILAVTDTPDDYHGQKEKPDNA
jgi:hypothetical protein